MKNPPPDSLLAVGWKLFLACYLFLHAPEAAVVGVVDMVLMVAIRFVVLEIIAQTG
jgi:hypothetical protein